MVPFLLRGQGPEGQNPVRARRHRRPRPARAPDGEKTQLAGGDRPWGRLRSADPADPVASPGTANRPKVQHAARLMAMSLLRDDSSPTPEEMTNASAPTRRPSRASRSTESHRRSASGSLGRENAASLSCAVGWMQTSISSGNRSRRTSRFPLQNAIRGGQPLGQGEPQGRQDPRLIRLRAGNATQYQVLAVRRSHRDVADLDPP
jgi:hypothetical protein